MRTPGLCALLGLRSRFTSRSCAAQAATLAWAIWSSMTLGSRNASIMQASKSEQIVPTVTGKVYNHSKRMKEKRAVLDGVAAELRRIIGKPPMKTVELDRLRLVA